MSRECDEKDEYLTRSVVMSDERSLFFKNGKQRTRKHASENA